MSCALAPGGFSDAERWLSARRSVAERRFDRLDALLAREPGQPPVTASSVDDNACVQVPYVEQADWARTVLAISVGSFLVGELSQVLRVRRDATRSNLRAELLFRAMFFGAILLLPVGRVVAPKAVIGGGIWTFSLGVLIGWLGLLLRWWSFATLGRYFTVVLKTSEDQPVVERGPYRVLRHPSYTGLLLAFVGCGLMMGNWVSAAGALALLLTALVYRIRIEERALTASIGDKYRTFAASRARLVPFVW